MDIVHVRFNPSIASSPAAQLQVFPHRQFPEKTPILRHVNDTQRRNLLRRKALDKATIELDRPLFRLILQESGNGSKQGGLPGPIGAQDGEYLPSLISRGESMKGIDAIKVERFNIGDLQK